jgi:hypothetical protein
MRGRRGHLQLPHWPEAPGCGGGDRRAAGVEARGEARKRMGSVTDKLRGELPDREIFDTLMQANALAE